jgi:hypothetical protein
MTNHKDYQLAASIHDACRDLRDIYRRNEDINLDMVLQTELGAAEYNAAPDPEAIDRIAADLKRAADIIRGLNTLTTATERRAIEAQGLLPWVFDN